MRKVTSRSKLMKKMQINTRNNYVASLTHVCTLYLALSKKYSASDRTVEGL